MFKFLKNKFSIKQNSKISPIHFALEAETSYALKNYSLALSRINKAIKNDKNNDMYYATKAKILIEINKLKNAENSINRSIKLNPNILIYQEIKKQIVNLNTHR